MTNRIEGQATPEPEQLAGTEVKEQGAEKEFDVRDAMEQFARVAESLSEEAKGLRGEVAEKDAAQSEYIGEVEQRVNALQAEVADMQKLITAIALKVGVDPEAVLKSDAVNTESESEAAPVAADKQLAEKQPRRVRTLPSRPMERLVKYDDGSTEWVPVDGTEAPASDSGDLPPTEVPFTPEVDRVERVGGNVEDESEESEPRANEKAGSKEAEGEEADEAEAEVAALEGRFDRFANMVELSAETKEEVEKALDEYASLTAKRRKSHVGRLLRRTSSLAKKVPGLRSLGERLSQWTDRRYDAVREKFDASVGKAQDEIEVSLYNKMEAENPDMTPEQMGRAIYLNSGLFVVEAHREFERRQVEERMRQSKPTNAFVDWWMRQAGLGKGRLKRYGAVAGIGAGAGGIAAGGAAAMGLGAVLGGFALPGVGALAGAAAGAFVGRHIAKRRANSLDGEGRTLAERQSEEDLELHEDAARQPYEIDNPNYNPEEDNGEEEFIDNPNLKPVDSRTLSAITEKRTATEQRENRRTTTAAVMAGAAGGKLAGSIVGGATGAFFGGSEASAASGSGADGGASSGAEAGAGSDATGGVESGATDTGAGTDLPPVENYDLETDGGSGEPGVENIDAAPVQGSEFMVEDGSYIIKEIQEYAAANNVPISSAEAENIFNSLNAQLGGDGILTTETYPMANGGVGISSPGMSSWTPAAGDILNSSLNIGQ